MNTPDKPLTQIEKIVVMMFSHPEKQWWKANDFMPPQLNISHPLHVGYEATARLSDLLKKYNDETGAIPPVFATDKEGKYRTVGVLWKDFEQSLKNYPDLIALAERTDIMSRFYGLRDKVAAYKSEPKPAKKASFKSYAV